MPRRMGWIAGAFLVTRVLVLLLYSPELHVGDQLQYVRVANSLIEHGLGDYLDPPYRIQRGDSFPYFRGNWRHPDGHYNPIFWDPLYPAFVAAVFQVSGHSADAVRWVQILLSFLTLLLGMRLVQRMFPVEPRAAEVFGWLFVAYLPLAGYATKFYSETLDAFLLVVLLTLAANLRVDRLGTFLGFGLLLGVYTTVKSYFLQLLPLLLLVLAWLLRPRDRAGVPRLVAALGIVVFGFAAALAPTLVRNHNLTGGHLLLSTKGPWNFWKDNNNFLFVNHDWRQPDLKVHGWLSYHYRTGEVPQALGGVFEDRTRPARPPCDVPLAQLAACERNNAIRFIVEDPVRFVRRAAMKLASLWSPNNYVFNRAPPGKFGWNQNYRIELPSWLRWVLQLHVMGLYIAVMLAAFIALATPVQSEADRRARALLVAWLLFLSLVVVPVGHGISRFRLPFMVPVMLFSALAFARGRGCLAAWRGPQAASPWVRLPLAAACLGWTAIVLVKLPLLLAP